MYKDVKFINANGDSFAIGGNYRLIKGLDLSNLTATNSYYESTIDGSYHQNTKLNNLDFDVIIRMNKELITPQWIEEQRRIIFNVFNPKRNPFKIEMTTNSGERYYVNVNLEGTPSMPQELENNNLSFQNIFMQFTSGDPYIYKSDSNFTEIATWEPLFEFPLIIEGEGIEFGSRSESLIVNVNNDGHVPTGMNIKFRALGTLKTPSILNVNTQEELKINIDLVAGDIVEVSTFAGNKYVRLIKDGVTKDIFSNLDLRSKFLQLEVGDNLFRYNALTNVDNLIVTIDFKTKLVGV